jgi:dihydroorotate dehydrogenase
VYAPSSTAVLRALSQRLNGKVELIGVGGITEGRHARAKIDAGAKLVQVYSGLIYRGPALVSPPASPTRWRSSAPSPRPTSSSAPC